MYDMMWSQYRNVITFTVSGSKSPLQLSKYFFRSYKREQFTLTHFPSFDKKFDINHFSGQLSYLIAILKNQG